MLPLLSLLWSLLTLVPSAFAAGPDTVTMPLQRWQEVSQALEDAAARPAPPAEVLQVDRSIDGAFRKGVLTATLRTTVQVLSDEGHVRIPVLDAATSIRRVRLDGQPTSLLREGGMYTVGVDQPGLHRIEVDFLQGHEDDRFARRLRFSLPPSGPTALRIQVPEPDIDAALAEGAVTAARPQSGGTLIEGQLDARGAVDLSWKRRASPLDAGANVRTEARLDTLFTLHEALVRGVAVFDLSVIDGETDRFDLVVPPDIEVVDVTGDAVLQWQTEAGADPSQPGRLAVLLRYLVDDQARVEVHFQFPVDISGGQPVSLRVPLPPQGTPLQGAIGVQGPAGLQVEVARADQAEALTLRDLPPELTELTQSPLLMGFRFTAPPDVALTMSRNQAVELTSTIVDDVQASTVLIEDGTEITKLRLRLRNNTRQYLAATLPPHAVLTHAFIDGQAVRPALAAGGGPEDLLFPLRQSERLAGGAARTHTVVSGDTLTGIAAEYLGASTRWTEILDANAGVLSSAWDLEPGQVLQIPAASTGSLQESSFVIELAYKVPGDGLGTVGQRAVTLPDLDVDVVQTTWHLYLPEALEPLRFDANLTQASAIHYDPFRRFRDFLDRALWSHSAWAGEYESILSQRKSIYRAERARGQSATEVTTAFPFTGERYRFKRILQGREQPRVLVTYIVRDTLPALRIGALLAGFGLVSWLLAGLRRGDHRRWAGLVLGLGLVLVLAHHVLGMHRRLLWGVDLALAFDLLRSHGPLALDRARRRLGSPATLLELVGWRNVTAVAVLSIGLLWLGAFPLLLSSVALVALVALRRSL